LRIPASATDCGAAEGVNVSAEPIAAQGRLTIVYRRIDEIRPNPRNPRRHDRRQIKKLARIIQKQGCNVPLLLDRYGNLLAGHARFEACRLLGLMEIPTICLEHLNEHQAQAFMLADNRLAELSEWDDRLLAEHLRELSLALDFCRWHSISKSS
jgi:ParB-like chromosome segregation protein Spo0J